MNAPTFTARMQRVMQLAREEADRLEHDYVGAEHLLLGLLREGVCGCSILFGGLVVWRFCCFVVCVVICGFGVLF